MTDQVLRTHVISVAKFVLIALVAFCLSSCALWPDKWRGGRPREQAQPVASTASAANHEELLRERVMSQIEQANRNQAQRAERLRKKKPYFYKEYGVYPEGPGAFDVLIQKTESHTAPYVAEVRMPKQRFATRFHRKRDDARADTYFYRYTGLETVTYEFRNGRWQRIGSFFMADKTETLVNGEWMTRDAAPGTGMEPDEKEERGFWRRSWSFITGK